VGRLQVTHSKVKNDFAYIAPISIKTALNTSILIFKKTKNLRGIKMVIGGLLAIFIAIWIFRTAIQEKTGNALLWVAGSFVTFLAIQVTMIYFNIMIIEIFDGGVSTTYDNAGGLNARDNSDTAGLQSGTGGTLIGIIFEILPFIVPFFIVAVLRQVVMLKQAFNPKELLSGTKLALMSIKNSFKTAD
jgi:hypothetical protein